MDEQADPSLRAVGDAVSARKDYPITDVWSHGKLGQIIDMHHAMCAEIDRLRDALEFYADPETYFAVAFRFDPPTGGFDDDFDEEHGGDFDRPMPGKLARATLKVTP